MKFRIFSLLTVVLGLTMVSCSDEDPITPSGDYSVVRFDFPQGNNDFDNELKELHDQYGIYFIYKDITLPDLNRKWTSVGTDFLYYGNDVPASDVPFYVDFFKNRILKHIDDADDLMVFPVKVYLMDNFRAIPPSEEDNEDIANKPADANGDKVSRYFQIMKTDGFDYWAVSFKKSEIEGRTHEGPKRVTALIFYTILKEAIHNGKFSEPDGLRTGIDFETELGTPQNTKNPNCPQRRGIPIRITDHFGTVKTDEFENTKDRYVISSYVKNGERDLFLEYLKVALYYTPTEFAAKYPSRTMPLLHEKYNLILDYFKSKGVDLAAIAAGE